MKNRLDIILDECLQRILVKGERLEDCLKDYPEQAEELESLLRCVMSAKEVTEIEPRPEFRARARYQFLAAVRESQSKKARGIFAWRPVWATVSAAVLVFVLVSSVTVAASGNAMPDELLYPVKTITEQARLQLAVSPVRKAELNAELADRRVAEIVHLAGKGKSREIESLTERLNRNLERIVELSGAGEKRTTVAQPPVPKPTPKPAPAAAPASKVAPKTERALEPSRVQDNRTAGAAMSPAPPKKSSDSSPKPPPGVSAKKLTEKEKLKQAVTRYAQKNPGQLREALQKAPESVKQALRRALAISEKGYEQARTSLEDDP